MFCRVSGMAGASPSRNSVWHQPGWRRAGLSLSMVSHGEVVFQRSFSGSDRTPGRFPANFLSTLNYGCSGCIVSSDNKLSSQFARFQARAPRKTGIGWSECACQADSLNEEIKGLKGHRLGVPKMMCRQLATERFTEPCEAIVTRFLKRTPTLGGKSLWEDVYARKAYLRNPAAIRRRR
jgi:hypothetical protein